MRIAPGCLLIGRLQWAIEELTAPILRKKTKQVTETCLRTIPKNATWWHCSKFLVCNDLNKFSRWRQCLSLRMLPHDVWVPFVNNETPLQNVHAFTYQKHCPLTRNLQNFCTLSSATPLPACFSPRKEVSWQTNQRERMLILPICSFHFSSFSPRLFNVQTLLRPFACIPRFTPVFPCSCGNDAESTGN